MTELLSLSQVAFMPPFPDPSPVDSVGELMWIELGSLYIDPRYQRGIGRRGENNIRKIIETFSWSLFSPLVVARRGPRRYAIIDGQHRAMAALTHGGIDKVPCLVITGDEYDEAKAFAVINGQVTAIMPTQIWHARVVAGDVNAVLLKNLLDGLGVKITKFQKAAKFQRKGETAAVSCLERCFRTYPREVLIAALQIVVETGDGNPGMLKSPIIEGSCRALAARPGWVNAGDALFKRVERAGGVRRLWVMAESAKGKSSTITFADTLSRVLDEK